MWVKVRLFFVEMFKRFQQNSVPDLSAQCAYYFMMSFFPFLLVLITVLSYFPITAEDLFKILGNIAPQTNSNEITRNLENVVGLHRKGLVSLGILFTIWPALSGIESLIKALNYSYGVTVTRGFFKSKLLALILMFGLILGIISALVFTVLGQKIGELAQLYFNLPNHGLYIWNTFRFIISLGILNLVFLVLYMFAPSKRVTFWQALPGCLFASFGWHYASLGFSFYVNHFNNFSATYGSLGAMIILMIWFYLTAMILILGGQMNSVLETVWHKS